MAHHEQRLRVDEDGAIYHVVLVDGEVDDARTIPDPHGRTIRSDLVFPNMSEPQIMEALRLTRGES